MALNNFKCNYLMPLRCKGWRDRQTDRQTNTGTYRGDYITSMAKVTTVLLVSACSFSCLITR